MIQALLDRLGIGKYLPGGPVLDPEARGAFDSLVGSGVSYTGPPRVDHPVLPLQVWGVHYDLDLVLESTDPRYDMHEYARVQTPRGPIWLAKDALASTRSQSIVADVPDIDQWLPELPVVRKSFPLTLTDRSRADWLDLTLRYENLEGDEVEVHYEGRPPTSRQAKRSGNTMGHSASVALAVLDIPARDFGRRASVQIGGQELGIRRILGLVPVKVCLVQSQGGLGVGDTVQRAGPKGLVVDYRLPSGVVPTEWTVADGADGVVVSQDDGFRCLSHRFRRDGDSLELVGAQVRQFERADPVCTLALHPALPDLRRPFARRHSSRYALDIGDQRGLATGRLEAWWEQDKAHVALIPEAPSWTLDRPMHTTVEFGDEVRVRTERVPIRTEGS